MKDQIQWDDIKNGDYPAFEQLYHSYYQFLFVEGYKICGDKELTKDCLHEMFLELWAKRSALPPVAHVGFYLKTYIRRKVQASIKQNKTNQIKNEHVQDLQGPQDSYEELLVRLESSAQLRHKIQNALLLLSPGQRKMIEMKFFKGLDYNQIADETNASSRTIYNQIYEALKILRKALRMLFLFH